MQFLLFLTKSNFAGSLPCFLYESVLHWPQYQCNGCNKFKPTFSPFSFPFVHFFLATSIVFNTHRYCITLFNTSVSCLHYISWVSTVFLRESLRVMALLLITAILAKSNILCVTCITTCILWQNQDGRKNIKKPFIKLLLTQHVVVCIWCVQIHKK